MASEEEKRLLDRAKALTGIVRTAWITMIVGSLYAWLTLASLSDIEFFLPEKTLALPIAGIGISTEGFFVFAPALLLASFLYFHLMLARLWECYGSLTREFESVGKAHGLSVEEAVSPWFLTVLIPHKEHGFDSLARIIAIIFGWAFCPITIVALGYRYLRAHDYSITIYHCLIISICLAFVYSFYTYRRKPIEKEEVDSRTEILRMVSISVASLLASVLGSVLLIEGVLPDIRVARFLSPNAQLYRAELSRKPAGWDELGWQEIERRIAHLEMCQESRSSDSCPKLADRSTQGAEELVLRIEDQEMLRQTIVGAELGLVPSALAA